MTRSLRPALVALTTLAVVPFAFAETIAPHIVGTVLPAQTGDWESQVRHFSLQVRKDPTKGENWYRLAYAQEMLGRHEDSIESYTETVSLRHKVPQSYIGMARVYALMKKGPEAMRSIRMASVNGWTNINALLLEPLFEPYLEDPHFLKSIDYIKNPVHQYPNGDILAFWLGEWVYKMKDGSTGGHSLVNREKRGFTIVEKWTSADGSTARSVYTYDKVEHRWIHTWTSSTGEFSRRTVRGVTDGVELLGTTTYPDGTQILEKENLRRKPDGTIEQTIAQSIDRGETWIQVSQGTFMSVKELDKANDLKVDGLSKLSWL